MTKLLLLLRLGVVAALLAAGAVSVGPIAAQDDTEVAEQADETVAQAEDVAEDDDDGFDWGLLGLLGLLGLAGLFRRPQPVVHDTERVGTRSAGADDTRI